MVKVYLHQRGGTLLEGDVPDEKFDDFLKDTLGFPDDLPPLSPEEGKRIDILRGGMCLAFFEGIYLLDKNRPFDKEGYISIASDAYNTPKDDLRRVLEVGEEIFGTYNKLRLMDYVGSYLLGEDYKVDGMTLEECAKSIRCA